ncbi:TadG family pilus assembly protein [Stenotrophomonas mori]|uniref:DUF2134 domain-containing protein n=1 Tax=Stenotrophomonas mori TaxID=2871096 RepID=A0ABT0SDW0_9GAMM|nr:TadG family pilus assembly protein [Stenotrophomonas mori]MCL7713505.1 hypothetical protein [Stenotrophomonas mori]
MNTPRLLPLSSWRLHRNQHGGGAVMMMLLLAGLVVILGLVEIGYLYWAKRDAQKVADLAALAGAQRLETCTADHGDNLAARRNAVADNAFEGALAITCGYWGAELPGAARFVPADAARPLNAVRVTVSRQAVPFFGQAGALPMVNATAVARRTPPQAAFSVGSRLLNINGDAPLPGLLRLVGIDVNSTQIASYKALADVKITPRGLLEALGVTVAADITAGELNHLLSTQQLSVGKLLELAADAARAQGLLDVGVGLLEQELARVGLRDVMVQLGSTATSGGLFASIVGGSQAASSALDLDVNALDLLGTSISIANAKHAVEVNGLSVVGIDVMASVVEPASIAIGPVGTTAYNSQVRLFLDIDSKRIPAVGAVLDWLGTRIRLPTYIDVIDGFGRLDAIDCSARPVTATVDVTSAIANICIGKASTPWDSTRDLCGTGLAEEQLVTLLGGNMLTSKIALDALSQRDRLTLREGETGTVMPNDLQIGTLVARLVDELLGTLGALFAPQGNSSEAARNLATQYLEATKVNGFYNPANVINALQNGHANAAGELDLPALGDWNTQIPGCKNLLLVCVPVKVDGSVWEGFRRETGISDSSLVGGLLDVLGITACEGLISGLLNYNNCVRNSLAKYLQTKPGGVNGSGGYNPVTGSGTCSSVLCLLLKPVVHGVLRPLLDSVGRLLSVTLSEVLGLQLGRTDVHMHSIQCGRGQLVE